MSKKPPPFTKALVRNLGVTEAAAVSSLNTGLIPKGVAPPGSKRARGMAAQAMSMGDPSATAAERLRLRQQDRSSRFAPQDPGMVSVLSAAAPAPAPGAGAPPAGGRRRRRNTKKISRRRRQHTRRGRR